MRRQRSKIHTVQLDAAGVWLHEPPDCAQQRRLAGAGTTEQHEQFAGSDLQVETIHCRCCSETDSQIGDRQQGIQCPALKRSHIRERSRSADRESGPMEKNVAICAGVGKMLVSASNSGRIIAWLAGTALA